ncbi:hypothetical protein PAXRUDRAFT_179000 [Paxillus rubicundulus Ve08.2h10]|uniref:Alpha-type protein kinase domain-containing protein n=1 Tax=Paxillus rubicundulus Ve08.2h10 TaxID=930991 RepID=A0A0D0CQW9_9AGAM|nr:hypothetical protein PAXRUDRAFT_179000 [Paxillus rubicundulus Ve08.2h10]
MIRTGTFKSAHPGWLTLTAPPIKGLGSQAHHKVVIKRPFYRVYSDAATQSGPYKIGQYSLADDIKKLFVEANVLFWAKSLLQLTYTFIDHCIASSSTPLPFSIPRVRFVEAGLALSFAQGVSKVMTKAGSAWAVFLLEELIRGSDEAFMKFIHNMDSNPLLQHDNYSHDLSLFFAFTQHVQYVKTGGLAFISDYQGSTEVLSDPQILTHPSVSDGCDIFGDGNIEMAVDKFEEQHVCNHYCKWEGFGLSEFEPAPEIL